ncbi:39S ribosomal protein L19, mitochondrial [Copidosoma floridanum]|uniref:39S ribosomal protein L19, mitochondrial n=1 Tax=Copidosoma floridanum TaxID=29053 RepID=UPI0006C9AE88|nr:39S ribosomal protein L19, mitochondrial [Copidosoma floridanum]
MSITGRLIINLQLRNIARNIVNENRCLSSSSIISENVMKLEESVQEHELDTFENTKSSNDNNVSSTQDDRTLLNYRYAYPEFLPDPNMLHRNFLREKLERQDMLARRSNIEIPEFYVGSILSVTHSDKHAPGKTNRFLGICIFRKGCGLRHSFILRNVIDKMGVEVLFEMYDPTIQKIEVIRLEKRLDDELFYLRDAPPEYSTFPLDMEPEYHPEGMPIRINDMKITLKPPPWTERWERRQLEGVVGVMDLVNEKRKIKAGLKIHTKPWEKYDLMKMYRETIPEEEQKAIFSEIQTKLHELELHRHKMKRSRSFVKPKKTG